MDVTKNSKYLLANATTRGVKIFDTTNGDQVAEVPVPGIMARVVCLSYSDKYFALVSESNRGVS